MSFMDNGRDIYDIETPQLKGKRSKKGKKRQGEIKLSQAIHSTKSGLGCVVALREKKNGNTRTG